MLPLPGAALTGLPSKLDWVTVGRLTISVDPSLLSLGQRSWLGKLFRGDQPLESGKPVLVVSGTIIRFAAVGSCLELLCEGCGPLSPGEMTLRGESHGEREYLRLPGLGKDWSAIVAR